MEIYFFFFFFAFSGQKKKKKEEAKWLDEKRQLMTKVFSFRPWGKLELDFRLCLFYLTRKWKHLWKQNRFASGYFQELLKFWNLSILIYNSNYRNYHFLMNFSKPQAQSLKISISKCIILGISSKQKWRKRVFDQQCCRCSQNIKNKGGGAQPIKFRQY